MECIFGEHCGYWWSGALAPGHQYPECWLSMHPCISRCLWGNSTDSKVHGANMGPTWVLSAPDGPHVGPMNLATRVIKAKWHIYSNIPLFIDSDNDLLPVCHKGIIWTGDCLLIIGHLGTNFSEMLKKKYIFIQECEFEKSFCKIAGIMSQSQCAKLVDSFQCKNHIHWNPCVWTFDCSWNKQLIVMKNVQIFN